MSRHADVGGPSWDWRLRYRGVASASRALGKEAAAVDPLSSGNRVTYVHELDVAVDERIEHRHDVVAREREDALDAGVLQGTYEDIGAAHAAVDSRLG